MLNLKKELLDKKKVISIIKINSNSNSTIDFIASIVKNEPQIIQLEMGNINSKYFLELCFKVQQITSMFDSLLIIKDRLDIVQIINSDGLYMDDSCYDIRYIKNILSDDKIIGSDFNSDHCDYNINDKKYIVRKYDC